MRLIRLLLSIIFIILIVAQASSQGYAGTVTTGKGIIPSLRVGSGRIAADSLGSGNLANLTGLWSFDLLDTSSRHMELEVQQSNESLFGFGNITADGGGHKVKASGSISGSNIDLSASIIDSSEMYRLEVTKSGTFLTGKYDVYSSGVISRSGRVAGSIKSSRASRGTTVILGNDLSQAAPIDVRQSAKTQESMQGAISNGTDHRIERRSFSSISNGGPATTSDVSVTSNYS